MSQITRCPHCQTSFKVVADQLRLAEGWVRCGQCKQIFDAFECLVDDEAWIQPPPPLLSLPSELTRPNETSAPASREPTEALPPPEQLPHVLEEGDEREAAEPAQVWREHVHDLVGVPAAMPTRQFASRVSERLDGQDRREPVLWPLAEGAAADHSAPEPEFEHLMQPNPLPEVAIGPTTGPEPEPEPEPEPLALREPADALISWSAVSASHAAVDDETDDFDFVRAARRGAFWRRPLVRLVLIVMSLVLVAALGLQVAVRERDSLAALYPQAQPGLARLCEPLGCTLAAPRRIADVMIDASSFVRERTGAPAYALQLSIKNVAPMAVATPAFELTLMDAREQPVLRRVLTAADLGAPAQLAARGDWSTSVRVRVLAGAEQVSGYRLLAFYP